MRSPEGTAPPPLGHLSPENNVADKIRPMTPEELRQEQAAAEADVMADAKKRLEELEAHEGGRYMVDGRMVDAEGKPVK